MNEHLQNRRTKAIEFVFPEMLLNKLRALVSTKHACRDGKQLCDSVVTARTLSELFKNSQFIQAISCLGHYN